MSHQDYNRHQQQQPIQQHDTSHSQQDYSLQTHILLAHSWLLVLVVAPLTISLLIWVLVLLVRQQRRRRRQDEKRAQILHKSLALLVGSEGRQTECNIPTDTSHHKEQSKYGNKRNRTSKQSNNAADQLLLDLTTSSSSTTSTNTSTSSAASTVQAGQLNPNDQDHNHHHHHVHHLEHDENHLQNQQHAELAQARQLGAWHRSFNAYRDLIDHTQCYLITLTSQEILACLVAFSLAILNIIRTRNLFSCNLIIFALIATKLLSLLSLATFTFAKLIRLLRLRAPPVACATATTTTTTTTTTASSHRHHNDHQKPCQECRKLQFPAVIQPVVGSRTASRGQLKLDIIGCISEESSLDPQSLNPDAQGSHSDRSPRGAGNEQQQQLTDEQQATISRLLVGHSSSANGAACQLTGTSKLSSSLQLHSADDFARSPSNQLLMSALRVLEGKNADLTSGPAAAAEIIKDKPAKKSRASTLVLALLSSALALFCLYMRLVGVPSSNHQPSQHLNHLHLMTALNRNLTDWAISISTYPTITLSATGGAGGGGGARSTSTTTEASTRYESTSGDGLDGTTSVTSTGSNSSEAVHLVQAASLSSLQQTTSQLRHLIDAHELHTFAQLLLDTQLQTSRFSCNLSSGNYAPLARSTMLTIYLGTLAIVALIGTLIQRVGRRKMKQFLLASQMQLTPETATGGRQQQQQHRSLFQALPSQLLSRHHHDSIQATNTNQIINQSMEKSLLKQQQQQRQRKLSGGSSGGGAPLSLFGRQNSQRYSDLLKQNLRHHQSLAELASYGGVNGSQSSSLLAMQNQHKQRRRLLMREQRQQHKLARNASSMSSLLFGLTNSSSGTADNRASRKLTATKRHLLAAGHRPVEGEKRHHMRRLAVSQPSNLNALGRQQVTTAAQKLAWLPQGSGAGVAASLYQIEANTSQRTSSSPNESFELTNLISKGSRGLGGGGGGGMGAHFPPITSNQTRSSASNKAKNQGQQSACVAMRAGLPRAHQARGKIGITSTSTPASKSTSTSSAAEQEHRELKQDLSLTKSIILFAQLLNHGPVLLMLAIGTFLPDGIVGGSGQQQQQQQQQVDGLQEQPATEAATSGGGGAGWTGVHDNAFAWLMLVEALAWPLLLCASDTQIAHAFRRSLRASSCTPPATATVAQCSPPGAPLSSAAAHATSAHQTSRLSLANGAASELGATGDFKHKQWPLQFAVASQQQRLNQSSAGGCGGHRLLRNHSHKQINLAGSRLDFLGNGKRAAGGHDDHVQYHKHLAPRGANFANSANNYLLGPSSTYPNFMFAFGGVSGSKQPPGHLGRATFAASASGTEIYSQPPANGQRVALAGELGLLTTAVNDRFEANGSIRESSPNLYDQLDATAAGATCWPPVIRGDHQNLARYDSDQTRYLASRKTSSNLLINVGRRLFKLGRRRDRRGRRVSSGAKMSGSGAFGTGTSANTDLADGSGARGGGDHQPASKRIRRSSELSPTSSLSTLIRKFNHDNYTSVCKQYENHNIIIANENNNNNNKGRPDMASEQVAAPIEAGDTGESGASKTTSADHEIISLAGETTCDGALAVEQRICARKGGLAYEFSLHDGRINPMLATTTSIGSGTRKQRDSGVKQQVVTSNSQLSSSNLMAVSDKMARLLDIDVAVVSGDRNLQNTAGKTKQSSPLVENIQQPANGRADTNRNQKPLATVVSGSANDKVATELEQTSTPLAKQTANEDDEEQRRRRPPSGGASSKPKMPLVSANLPQVATGYGNDQDSSAVATKPQQQQQQRPPSPPESKQTSAAAPAAELQANSNNYLNQMQLRLQQFEDNETAAADAVTCVDYATLRSLDDALSLVSVSSEFEYHDIGRLGAPFAQTSSSSSSTGVCRVESAPAAGQIESRKAQHRLPQANESEHLVVKEPPKEGATSSSSSISNQRPTTAASMQADDLRFPSFLATPQAPAAQSHAQSTSSSSSQVPNRRPQSTSHSNLVAPGSGSRRRPDGGSGGSGGGSKQGSARAAQAKISSSLLELTAAKYAGSGAQKPAINATLVGTNGTNSSTITKSRAAQKSSPSLVQFGEFTRNRSGSSAALGVFATGASRNAHDQGNVRARIMRMEQQQHQQHQAEEEQKQRRIQMTGRHHQQVSSPNLTALQLGSGSNRANRVDSSHHKQGPSTSSSSSTSTASTTASMIPVLASSAGRHHNHVR